MKIRFILLFAIVLGAANAFAYEPLFDTRLDFPMNDQASFLVCADLDGDPCTDIAVAPYYGDSVSIYLSNCDGTLQPPVKYASLNSMISLFASDLNNDSFLDLVTIHPSDNRVAILLNGGTGTFQLAANYSAGRRPSSVYCADLNNDNYEDILVADSQEGISLLLNAGDGTFLPRRSFNVISYPISVVAADFDDDGNNDVAAVGYHNPSACNLVILRGNGFGQFEDTTCYNRQGDFHTLRAGDLNGDGYIDIAATMTLGSYDSLIVFYNDGAGAFDSLASYSASALSRSISIEDLNGDGANDMAVVGFQNDEIQIYTNDGSGAFILSDTLHTADEPRWVSCADFDLDGDPDLAVAHLYLYDHSVSIFRNTGDGNFQVPLMIFDIPANSRSVTCANLNGDQYSDLVVGISTDSVVALINNGDLSFTQTGSVPAINGAERAIAGNFNGDEFDDLAILHSTYDDSMFISIHISDGTGSFQEQIQISLPYTIFTPMLAADLNEDQVSDLVIRGRSDTLLVLLNNGDGSFGAPTIYITPTRSLCAADLDSDGDNDLVAGSDNFTVFRNNGFGVFEQAGFYETPGGQYRGIFAFDVDGDNNKDLIFYDYNLRGFYLMRNIGNCDFAEIGVVPASPSYASMIAADLNCDGLTDLVPISQNRKSVYPYLNTGNASFVMPIGYGTEIYTNSIDVGDLNGDGVVDLVTVGSVSNRYAISILINKSEWQSIPNSNPRELPKKLSLLSNFPNPFNAQTTIKYNLPKASDVSIEIFDIVGRKIETLQDGFQQAGKHSIVWDAEDRASGVYFYRIKAGGFSKTERCVLLK